MNIHIINHNLIFAYLRPANEPQSVSLSGAPIDTYHVGLPEESPYLGSHFIPVENPAIQDLTSLLSCRCGRCHRPSDEKEPWVTFHRDFNESAWVGQHRKLGAAPLGKALDGE